MSTLLAPALAFAAALGAGLIAGVFYAFSTFVMKALSRQPHPEGMAAMQTINVIVINPMFLGVFLGTTGSCAAAVFVALLRWNEANSAWLLAGGLIYLVGTFGVTALGNVPLNNALARVARDDPDGLRRWEDYVRRWNAWNHVRTLAGLAAAGALTVAFRLSKVGE
jgi:uncharacterized membrane protein